MLEWDEVEGGRPWLSLPDEWYRVEELLDDIKELCMRQARDRDLFDELLSDLLYSLVRAVHNRGCMEFPSRNAFFAFLVRTARWRLSDNWSRHKKLPKPLSRLPGLDQGAHDDLVQSLQDFAFAADAWEQLLRELIKLLTVFPALPDSERLAFSRHILRSSGSKDGKTRRSLFRLRERLKVDKDWMVQKWNETIFHNYADHVETILSMVAYERHMVAVILKDCFLEGQSFKAVRAELENEYSATSIDKAFKCVIRTLAKFLLSEFSRSIECPARWFKDRE